MPILLADDDPDDCLLMRHALVAEASSTACAPSATERNC
jgi:hypothetical protein